MDNSGISSAQGEKNKMEYKEVNPQTHFCPQFNIDTTKFNWEHEEEITVDAAIESFNNNINLIAKAGDSSPKQVDKLKGNNKQKDGKGDKESETPIRPLSKRIASRKLHL